MRLRSAFAALLSLAALAVVPEGAPRVARADAPPRPHIVHIVADDLGWKDVGFHGAEFATPHIDSIAAAGVRLEGFYAQPFCTQTRACLMTGRYPFRYGLQTAVILSAHGYGLATDELTTPQALAAAGYSTALVGKWHLGHGDRKYWPGARGFQRSYGPLIGEIDYFSHEQHGVLDWYRDGKPVREEGYSTTLLGDEAVRTIEGHDPKSPLYLYLAFNAPHAPYQAEKAVEDRFPAIADPTRRTYAAMVAAMDDQIGRVLAALEKKGMRGDTLIVFHSDNGGTRDSQFSGEVDTSKIRIPCDNGPYRDGKGNYYEGGTRVVAAACWPGHIPAGKTVDGVMHAVDMLPTFAAVAGASLASSKPLDGLDMGAVMAGTAPSPRTEVVLGVEMQRAALRQGPWKLVWRATLPSKTELFDLSKDPYEKEDLAASQTERVLAMKARVDELARVSVPSLLVGTEMNEVRARLKRPPVIAGEDPFAIDDDEHGAK